LKTHTHRIPGLVLTDHLFQVPLDHANPSGAQIEIFAREVCAPGKEDKDLPWLVFLQGGPGFGSPRPAERSGWLQRALEDYRVLLLDQRGTARSSPATAQTLAALPGAEEKADYLKHFRADSIVQDAEWIRGELLGKDTPWSILGQSFGGFCAVHYLAAAPHGLKEALITGGLPPLDRSPDEVYRATYRRVLQKNEEYFKRYPQDQEIAREIVQRLEQQDVRLPSGDRLTPRRFQHVGITFGASGGYEQVHYLLEQAFVRGASGREISAAFLSQVERMQSFDTNPIYAILHEAIYCQNEASRWSAQRVLGEYPQFALPPEDGFYFTGEMVYPWMFSEYAALQPLLEAAEILAEYEDWPRLYDLSVLSQNQVPCAAAVYYNDMYVERAFSEETAQTIPGIQVWVTNEYEHNGLRADGSRILDRLLKLVRGE
jgi:pimeloyl-ACP methyl ester carboxylesterase